MRFSWLLCLLLASLAFAQAAPSTPAAQPKPSASQEAEEAQAQAKPAQSNIPPEAAVITIKGMCEDKPASRGSQADCQTVITRAAFENLAEALQPNMQPAIRQRLANAYPRMLLMAHEAHQRGLDKGLHFEEMMQFARLQILSQELNRSLQQQSAQVPDKEIADYYHDNTAAFEQLTLQRIFVPRRKQIEPAKDGSKAGDSKADPKAQEQATEEAMSKEADTLRARAAGGEDFDKLEKEAFEAAGLKGNAPSTSLGKMRRASLPPAHSAIFELKAGGISPVINDGSGYYIYKIVAKEVLPLDQVKEEIHGTLQTQRYKDAMQAVEQSATTELNDAYFGNAPSAPAPGAVRPKPGAGSKEAPKTPPTQPK